MPKTSGTRSASLSPTVRKAAIVASRWNEAITKSLADGARQALLSAGLKTDQVKLFWVAGAFELPQAAEALARSGDFDLIVPVGCLIRGDTSHFEVLAHAVTKGLEGVGRAHRAAVAFGVLTVEHFDQAISRAGGLLGNKGEEAALAALDLWALKKEYFRG